MKVKTVARRHQSPKASTDNLLITRGKGHARNDVHAIADATNGLIEKDNHAMSPSGGPASEVLPTGSVLDAAALPLHTSRRERAVMIPSLERALVGIRLQVRLRRTGRARWAPVSWREATVPIGCAGIGSTKKRAKDPRPSPAPPKYQVCSRPEIPVSDSQRVAQDLDILAGGVPRLPRNLPGWLGPPFDRQLETAGPRGANESEPQEGRSVVAVSVAVTNVAPHHGLCLVSVRTL